jgi:manganese-dependent inorganic pyrophosphatase
MRTNVVTCAPDDLVEDGRDTLQSGPIRYLMVTDESGTMRGLVGRSDLLRSVRQRLALVDHNERAQSVMGIEEAEVIAVVDHHRVADFWTRQPPFMRLEPVGSTSTIVAKLFRESGVNLSPDIAGVLLSGVLADTLGFRGPTTTEDDRRVASYLAERAGVEPGELSDAILAIASDVSHRSADDVLASDFKEFTVGGCRFGLGTLETTRGKPIIERRQEFVDAMARLNGYTLVMFALIDIAQKRTTLLVSSHAEAVAEALGGHVEEEDAVVIEAIVSRKKDIVPRLGNVCAAMLG